MFRLIGRNARFILAAAILGMANLAVTSNRAAAQTCPT